MQGVGGDGGVAGQAGAQGGDEGSDLRKLSSGKPLTSYIAQAELCKRRLNLASYLLKGQFNM